MKNLLAKTSAALLLIAAPAHAQAPARAGLAELVNAYRANPGQCEGRPATPAPPLAHNAILAAVKIGTGTFLDPALEQAGYPVAHAEAIMVDGPADARAAMAAIEGKYCARLLSTGVSAIGAARTGNRWQVVLAQPAAPSPMARLPELRDVGQAILGAANAARAAGQRCGDARFAPAPPLAWNDTLAEAALVHSRDMATQRYFSHQGKDGRLVGERAAQAGYRWRAIGENIAAGQQSPQEAVAGWLTSPGHCANLMNPRYTEMGAAYGLDTARKSSYPYWTQVFGAPLNID